MIKFLVGISTRLWHCFSLVFLLKKWIRVKTWMRDFVRLVSGICIPNLNLLSWKDNQISTFILKARIDQEYIYSVRSKTILSMCNILFKESRKPFYSMTNGYKNEMHISLLDFPIEFVNNDLIQSPFKSNIAPSVGFWSPPKGGVLSKLFKFPTSE